MEYRQLGRTRERISTIGMGTWKMGTYRSAEERSLEVEAVKKGIEMGINLIDTAEMYATGRSEEVVGEAVNGIREDVFVATKVSPDNLRHNDLIAACERSLRRLNTSYIDLYQVHWPNPRVPISETMGAMEGLVREGKVRYIGVSNFSVSQTEEARASLGSTELASNQSEYSIVSRGVETDLLPYCVREGLTLIAYSPLARGRIPVSAIPADIIQRYKLTPSQIMLNWVTRNDRVVAIPKAARLAHLRENADSISIRLGESDYDRIGKG